MEKYVGVGVGVGHDSTAGDKTTCLVCGDKALGFYNFNAITCESCKAFFRRNAYKQNLKCHFVDECAINPLTRRICSACRLKKCFSIGMKKEYILSEEEKVARKHKIEDNRGKLIRKLSSGVEVNNSTKASSRKKLKVNHCDCVSSSDSSNTVDSHQSFVYPDTTTNDHDFHLTIDEQKQLEELLASHSLIEPVFPYDFTIENKLIDVLKFTDYLIRNIIKMAKSMPGFKKLCQEDQIALLKGGSLEIIIIRSAMALNLETECWEPTGQKNVGPFNLNLSILKEANENLYEAHKKFVSLFEPRWRKDLNVMVIIIAIVLFTLRPNIIQKEIVRSEQQEYVNLLKRYIRINVYTDYEADKAFAGLMKQLTYLRVLNEQHVKVYLDANPDDIGPLLVELFSSIPKNVNL